MTTKNTSVKPFFTDEEVDMLNALALGVKKRRKKTK